MWWGSGDVIQCRVLSLSSKNCSILKHQKLEILWMVHGACEVGKNHSRIDAIEAGTGFCCCIVLFLMTIGLERELWWGKCQA